MSPKERQELPRLVPPHNKITFPSLGFALGSRSVLITGHAEDRIGALTLQT
jgi:hypothetical protein